MVASENRIEYSFKFQNNDLVQDKITGFKGVVMVCAQYNTGCRHYGLLSRKLKDGKEAGWNWVDETRLELVKTSVVDLGSPFTSGSMPNGPSL